MFGGPRAEPHREDRTLRTRVLPLVLLLLVPLETAAFGKNKIQYHQEPWRYLQSEHFDIYFPEGTQALAEFTAEVAESAYAELSANWQFRLHARIPFLVYPPEIRKVIYTTNAIESIQAQLRKVTKRRGAFPTADAVRKVLYLAIRKAPQRWSRPVKDWITAEPLRDRLRRNDPAVNERPFTRIGS